MNKLIGAIMLTSSILFLNPNAGSGQSKERSEIPEQYTWNLKDLYESDDAWKSAKENLTKEFEQIDAFKGKLGSSAQTLYKCLALSSEIGKEYSRLRSYSSMKFDQDTRVSKYLGMKQELEQLGTQFSSKAAFIEPEILAIPSETIDKFISQEKGLADYSFYLKDLQRRKEHTLSEKEERIMAEAGLMANSPYTIYSIFANAELPYKTITLSDGKEVRIDNAGYANYRALPNRADRELVFNTFFSTLAGFENTIGAQLAANVKKDLFYTRARGYKTCLETALDANNIPVDVYYALVKNVNDNLGSFHRYLKIKQRMMGLDTLKYSDVYAPVVKDVDLKYSIEQAYEMVLEAFGPLGDDYVSVVAKGIKDRWIDVYPNAGKRSGAYMSGSAYDVHPYVLLNYNDQYENVSTLAHELGHAMQSYLSNKAQPYPLADYPIFVAEVASTFNETLLINNQLGKIKDDNVRLSLLMNYLDRIKGTVFRQTQFAEFELRIHEMVEKGEPITGEALTKLYGDIVKRYYGHDQGICIIDDLYSIEWAYIPHFYYNYYVYQYATSFAASTALAEKVMNHEKGIMERYITFLSAGGSDYPIELLKAAGVDMTTSDPFEKTMAAMNRTMDEIEKILDKK